MAAVGELSIEEYDGWARHFERFPPGDPLAQRILAQIWADLRTMFSSGGRIYHPHDVAPWLETPELREKKAERQRRNWVATVAAAYSELDGEE